ncbi:MAG: ribonucleoside triphosphate reductase [Patescibacteria group bacterium]|nr:ribonucleoside triphosphate reductase [Patescibacteria group bacterium]
MVTKVRKRSGNVVDFFPEKISDAIFKAGQATGEFGKRWAKQLSDLVVEKLHQTFDGHRVPTVEQIQDIVEETLMRSGFYQTARAYILYRAQHARLRRGKLLLDQTTSLIKSYVNETDWRVRENANMSYSLQGLNTHISASIVARYWLQEIYPKEAAEAHIDGDLHIHDLSFLGPYCVGWDLQDLLLHGFRGVPTKIECAPPRHLRTALAQTINFFYTLQGESAGAQALSNFDTYMAPFIYYDKLSYKEIKQALQEFMFGMNVPTRVGFQTPFTNISIDLVVPPSMRDQPVIVGGELKDRNYGQFQKEMSLFNKTLAEIYTEGDANGKVFTFPIPTYNITADFDWNNRDLNPVWEMTAKYGIPYFGNFVNSDMSPDDARSMCCRLRLDKRELKKRGGGLFGSNPLTGSVGVVTLNMARIGYLAKSEDGFLKRTAKLMEIARSSLEVKRKVVERYTEKGLYPYSKYYLRTVKEARGEYWANHFSTIGLNGFNEAMVNFMGKDLTNKRAVSFTAKVLDFMRKIISDYQEETGNLYNLEATPAEGTSHRLARTDKRKFGNRIKVANEKQVRKRGAAPFYTNSSQLPVDADLDLFEALKIQDRLQTKYTGGTVFHIFLGERLKDIKSVKSLVKKVADSFSMPYFSLTPSFSICPKHGYIDGERRFCPKCDLELEAEKKELEKKGFSVEIVD